jgi:excisionase family DNA binding protein
MTLQADEISTSDAARMMGVTTKTIYRLVKSGAIEATKPFGDRGGLRINPDLLQNFYRRRRIATVNRRAAR